MKAVQISLFENINREKQAINRIKTYAPIAVEITGKPFYVAYSGGKDSDTIRILCELAGIKYDLVHNHTTVDAPETVYYVRSIPNIIINYPNTSMWKLIVKKMMPPTRLIRYCCDVLKEHGGVGRFVMTGVRWSESTQRSSRNSLEIQGASKRTGIFLNADNDENRREFETCIKKGKRILNPIIDWTDDDVWDFLKYYDCRSNPLYQCGYKRVGCVGCPMARKGMIKEFEQYPKYKENYIRAFQRMVDAHGYANTSKNWTSGEAVFDWWIKGSTRIPRELEGQLSLFEDI